MKSFIVFALFVAAAVAGPVYDYRGAEIEEQKLNNIGIDGFDYKYRTSDGQSASAVGTLKNVGTDNEALEVRGSFSYTGNDGLVYTVEYVANEFGFQPSAAHLPRN